MTPLTPTLVGLGMLVCGFAAPAWSQASGAAANPHCAATTPGQPISLHGLWRLVLWPEHGRQTEPASTGTLLAGPHPEYPGSIRGRLRRSGPGADLEAEVAGDLDQDGAFNLDESADGKAMDAVWTGLADACDGSIRGERRPAQGRPRSEPVWRFLLHKPAQPAVPAAPELPKREPHNLAPD